MITINLDGHIEIDENIFVQNAKKIVEKITNSDILSQSPLRNYDWTQKDISFDILLCDNDEIHEINREYRNKDMPTDVITFALFADSEPQMRVIYDNEIPLGEIIISIEKLKIQATENNKTFEEELYFILAHGILHLFGFVHQTEDSLEFMIELQQRLVKDVEI